MLRLEPPHRERGSGFSARTSPASYAVITAWIRPHAPILARTRPTRFFTVDSVRTSPSALPAEERLRLHAVLDQPFTAAFGEARRVGKGLHDLGRVGPATRSHAGSSTSGFGPACTETMS